VIAAAALAFAAGGGDLDHSTATTAAMAKEPTTQVAFRLPDSLITRLDRHVERMTKEHPGLDFSRADAVRSLLTRALDQIEGPSAPGKRGGR
jgi:hypothetical protein